MQVTSKIAEKVGRLGYEYWIVDGQHFAIASFPAITRTRSGYLLNLQTGEINPDRIFVLRHDHYCGQLMALVLDDNQIDFYWDYFDQSQSHITTLKLIYLEDNDCFSVEKHPIFGRTVEDLCHNVASYFLDAHYRSV